MSFLSIKNVEIKGVAACVPSSIEENKDFPLFSDTEVANFIKTTGVTKRRIADAETCSSDLCLKAAEKLIEDLNWNKEEIDCLMFVSQTPDYYLPATSVVLQERLGLSQNCYTLDISLGCSGWVYAMSVISSLLSHGSMKKGLLLSGDTISKICSPKDKSTYPLFGDAGTATALQYDGNKNSNICFSFNSDGSNKKTIIVEDGGFRNPVTPESFECKIVSDGIERNGLNLDLEGMNVFSFGITKAPQSVKSLSTEYGVDLNEVDYFIFHQANKFMNEKIRRKLKLPAEKVPYSLSEFGNTSCATIPLTMVTELSKTLKSDALSHIACGFGVGLSWGSCYFKTDKIVCPDLIIY